jgi:glutathione S-transferase
MTTPPSLRLLGTTTSPYTRKIRILATAAQQPFELIDTRQEAGAALLAQVAPLGKVPVLLVSEGQAVHTLPDSGLIAQWLWAHHRGALHAKGFELDPDRWEDRAVQQVVDGVLDAAINRFYLLRDGAPDAGYVARQSERVEVGLRWLGIRVSFRPAHGFTTLALGCALDWMVFRAVVDLARFPMLAAFRDDWTASRIGAGTEPG